ncbi:LuxR family transcriptional regulator [Sphingobacterium sp. SRCM116780]|uniref:helix-turn-helix transcriptional regulator n=1 Tax=Sphingobacterium sp. SRCM116780 TaxID=2907623 RepID=UPI001F1B0058|nr:LuxR C-terminal-related transcriptional regulator [Sphingobacterium sp. SRCM116780]UIR54480.1 LuxR family transcriptional regulator [Sphingobacterium sp. SRCM116780]
MRRFILIVVWLVGGSTLSSAQQSYMDSLQMLIAKSTEKEKTVDLQQQLADWYRTDEQDEAAIKLAEQSLRTSLEISENNIGVTKADAILSNVYTNREDFERSKEYIDKAYRSAKKQKNTLAMAYAHYASAVLHSVLFDRESTLKFLQQSLANIPDKDKEPQLVCKIYYQLYGIYTEWNDMEKSRKYIQTALLYAQKSGNKNLLANVYSAISVVYSFRYELTNEKKYLDSIMQPLDDVISLYKQHPGKVMKNTYANCLINKASYYLLYYNTNDPLIKQKIRDNVNQALEVAPADNDVISSAYGMLSELSMADNDLTAAESYLSKAYQLQLQRKKPYYHTLINVLNSLVSLHTKKGDYKNALKYQQKMAEYNGLLFDKQSASTTKRLEAQFEFGKKEKEITSLQEKAESRKRQNYLLLALIGIGLTGTFFVFRSYHLNLRYSIAREKQATAERNEAAMQVLYEQEEQARLKVEQELLTLKQQKLNDEVMANHLQLEHKNNILLQLQEKLANEEPINIQQILREETRTDNEFEKAKYQIQEIHPNFFKNLNEKAIQKLTSLDQKYCAYLYLGLDTKQIASILNIEAKSVRMTKYRLKQKFALDSETDLINYLKGIG